jgi:hypothetical protein
MTIAIDETAVIAQAATATPGVLEVPQNMPTDPAGFDATLWALLKDVRDAGVPLKGKIAEYAGFYHKTVNGSTQTLWDGATSDNKNNHDWPLSTDASFIKETPHTKMRVESSLGIIKGLYVSGDGIASGTTVVDISSSTVELSNANTSTKKKVTLTFTTQSPTTGLPLQPNKSLDKLTFLIMFRLPFSQNALNDYYGDPLSDAEKLRGTPAKNQRSWSYRANELRAGGSLKRLNQAGEQVNASNQRCDDSGASIEDAATKELSTAAAFLYYNDIGAVDLDGSVETAVKAQPLHYYLAITTEGSFLPRVTVTVTAAPEDKVIQVSSVKNIRVKNTVEFRYGTHRSQHVVEAITSTQSGTQTINSITLSGKIGFAYPVGTKIEFGADIGFRTLSLVQTPRNIYGLMGGDVATEPQAVRRRREVELGTYSAVGNTFTPDSSLSSNDGATITAELVGGLNRYYVKDTTPKIYLRLKYDAEELAANGVHTIGATVFELDDLQIKKVTTAGQDVYYAEYYKVNKTKYKFGFLGKGDLQFDNLAILDKSGVTMGWGKDIGQGLRSQYQYDIKFKILVHAPLQPATATEFVLRYKDRASAPISFSAPPKDVKTALLNLLTLKESALPSNSVTVTSVSDSGIAGYKKGWDVSIPHINMVPPDTTSKFSEIYSSNVFYQKSAEKVQNVLVETVPNILIDPPLEKDRWKLHTDVVDGTDVVAQAWDTFTKLLNDLCGGDWKLQFAVDPSPQGLTPAQQAAKDAQDTADRNDFEALLRSCYNISRGNAFLPIFNEYTFMDRFRLPDHDLLFPRWVKSVMEPTYYTPTKNKVPKDIRARMNAAESYVLMTVAYMSPGASSSSLNDAIKTKSLEKLVELVEARNPNDEHRRTTIIANLKKHFKQHLYRNIEEG